MTDRASFTDPLSSQQRADAQISNPATPITATTPLEWVQPTEELKTNDPSNGGITPSSGKSTGAFDISALNRWLATAQAGKSTPLGEAYGITGGGLDPNDVRSLPSFMTGPDKEVYEKKVVNSAGSIDESKKQKFLKDMNSIDITKKKPNSGAGINPDTGGSFLDTIDLADGFFSTPQLMSNKELVTNGSVLKFQSAYKQFQLALNEASKLPVEQRADFISSATGELKVSMLPILDKAKGIIYAQAGGTRTGQYDRLNDFWKELESYQRLYSASAEDINGTIKAYQDQAEKLSVAFTKLDFTQKSENAKTRLKSNPTYVGFIELMMEANPDRKAVIKNMFDSPTISDEEKTFIEDKFIGGSFKQLFDARAQAIKDFWPQAAAWFKDFDQIIQVKNEIYKTRLDDVLEDTKAPIINYNQLNFSTVTWY